MVCVDGYTFWKKKLGESVEWFEVGNDWFQFLHSINYGNGDHKMKSGAQFNVVHIFMRLCMLSCLFGLAAGQLFMQLGQDIDGEAEGDESGVSVSLSGDGLTLAVGAHANDGNGENSGHVRVFVFVDGNYSIPTLQTYVGPFLQSMQSGNESAVSQVETSYQYLTSEYFKPVFGPDVSMFIQRALQYGHENAVRQSCQIISDDFFLPSVEADVRTFVQRALENGHVNAVRQPYQNSGECR